MKSQTLGEILDNNRAYLFKDSFGHYVHNTHRFLSDVLCIPNYLVHFYNRTFPNAEPLNHSLFEINKRFKGATMTVQTDCDFLYANFSYPFSPVTVNHLLSDFYSSYEVKILEQLLKQETYIYLIRDEHTGFTKIGRSGNPYTRLKALVKQDTLMPLPNNFKLIDFWADFPITEILLHKEFENKRKRGEWFDLENSDICNIQTFFDGRS